MPLKGCQENRGLRPAAPFYLTRTAPHRTLIYQDKRQKGDQMPKRVLKATGLTQEQIALLVTEHWSAARWLEATAESDGQIEEVEI